MIYRFLTTTLVLLWFSVANHCVLADAFASPAKTAHHCGTKQTPTDPHDRCAARVCCELFSPMTADLDVAPHLTAVALGSPIPSAVLSDPGRAAFLSPSPQPPPADPPPTLPSLLGSLTLAQNAPPR